MFLFKSCLFKESPLRLIMGCALMPFCVCASDTVVTVWAEDTISLDLSSDECRLAVGDVKVWHNPDWCTGGTNVEGAVAVFKAVTNPDTANASTTTVSIADANKLSSIDWIADGCVRLLLSAEVEGKQIGDTLVSDISFGMGLESSAGIAFDVRTNAFQEIVNAKASTSLNYDLNWADVATKADISLVCTKKEKNGSVISVTTSDVASVQSPTIGSVDFATANLQWGDYVLLLREYAADGSKIFETESAGFSIARVFGTCVIVR